MDAWFKDIADYTKVEDYLFLIPAALGVEMITLFLVKYAGQKPFFKVDALNDWYERFGIFAVGADVLSLLIGVTFARYIYTTISPGLWSPILFVITAVIFQLFHDAFFYFAVIRQMNPRTNEMIEVFQDYAKENGGKILFADALMVSGTAIGAMVMKGFPPHLAATKMLFTLYAICFILFTASSKTLVAQIPPKAEQKPNPEATPYQPRIVPSSTWEAAF